MRYLQRPQWTPMLKNSSASTVPLQVHGCEALAKAPMDACAAWKQKGFLFTSERNRDLPTDGETAVEDNGLRLWTFRHFYLIDLTRRNSSFTLSVSTLPSIIFRGEYSAHLRGRAPWGGRETASRPDIKRATCTQSFADDPAMGQKREHIHLRVIPYSREKCPLKMTNPPW